MVGEIDLEQTTNWSPEVNKSCPRLNRLDHTFSCRTGVMPDSGQFRTISGGSLGLGAILADLRINSGDFRVRKRGFKHCSDQPRKMCFRLYFHGNPKSGVQWALKGAFCRCPV